MTGVKITAIFRDEHEALAIADVLAGKGGVLAGGRAVSLEAIVCTPYPGTLHHGGTPSECPACMSFHTAELGTGRPRLRMVQDDPGPGPVPAGGPLHEFDSGNSGPGARPLSAESRRFGYTTEGPA